MTGPGPGNPGPGDPVAEEVRRVLEEATRIVEALGGYPPGHGGPECRICPVCRLLATVRDLRPEVLEHLALAGRELLAAAREFAASAAERSAAERSAAERSAADDPEVVDVRDDADIPDADTPDDADHSDDRSADRDDRSADRGDRRPGGGSAEGGAGGQSPVVTVRPAAPRAAVQHIDVTD